MKTINIFMNWKKKASEFSSKNFIPLDNQLSVQSRAINEFAKWPSWHRLFFGKVDFFKGDKSIFFLIIVRWFSDFFLFFSSCFRRCYFLSHSPLVNTYRLQKHGPKPEKSYGKVKKSRHTDFRCWILYVKHYKNDMNK